MSSGSGQTGGSDENSEKARMRRSSDSISSTTMAAAWSRKARRPSGLGSSCAGDHLFHGEADGREGVLHLVRHLARQHLPAGELREIDEAVAVLFQLRRRCG